MTPMRSIPVEPDMIWTKLVSATGRTGLAVWSSANSTGALHAPSTGATLKEITGPTTAAGLKAERFAAPPTIFYDPALDDLYPREDDPRLKRYKSDAGLRVSYRGTPEHWTGATQPVNACFKVTRITDGALIDFKIGEIAKMSADDALVALATARQAWKGGMGEWPRMSLIERCARLERAVAELVGRRDEIVALLEAEIGKSKDGDAASEFDRTLANMPATIVQARNLAHSEGRINERPSVNKIDITLHTPRGIVLGMGPSNYPWDEGFVTTAFPALLMGNVLLVKPPRKGQLLLQTVIDIFAKHLPPGVLNLITGDGSEIITPIAKSGQINALYFIGSEKVLNNHILPNFPNKAKLKIIAGLGAKNGLIVQEGADPKTAAKLFVQGAFKGRGERCTGTAHTYVPRSMLAAFEAEVALLLAPRKAGMPWDPGVEDSPLADGRDKIERMAELRDDGLARGARIINAGGGWHNDTIFRAAVLSPLPFDSKIATEEVFGPIAGIIPYDNEDEVVAHLTGLGFDQQVAIVSAEGREEEALELAELLSNEFTEANIDGIPKRDDGEPGKTFGARHEVPLGLVEALRAASIPYTVSTPDTPRWRASLPTYALRRLRRKLERVSRKDEAGLAGGSDMS